MLLRVGGETLSSLTRRKIRIDTYRKLLTPKVNAIRLAHLLLMLHPPILTTTDCEGNFALMFREISELERRLIVVVMNTHQIVVMRTGHEPHQTVVMNTRNDTHRTVAKVSSPKSERSESKTLTCLERTHPATQFLGSRD